jgi:MoxR-like ATPase
MKKIKSNKNMEYYLSKINKLRSEISKVVVGQNKTVDGIIRSVITNGHVLVEGVPGTAKTLILRSVAVLTGCDFGRIQFTVDLLPTDIVGINTLAPDGKSFQVLKGPVFNHFLLADEINRAPPKTQSALLEAMAELQVSISRNSYKLEPPFFVMATQNPIESSGTYPLPEAQIDRFLFKLLIGYPEKEHEAKIIEQNITLQSFESYNLKKIMEPEDIIRMQQLVKEVQHTERINKYIVELVNATRTPKEYDVSLGKYISLGGSPRASIFLFIAAKADAFMNGQKHVSPQNVKNIAHDVLRHRIMLNYRAKVDNVTTDNIIDEVLSKVKIP